MPVTLQIIDDVVHLYTCTAPWSIDEYLEASKEGREVALALQDDPDFEGIIVIGDLRNATPLPKRMITEYPRVMRHNSDIKIKRLIAVNSSRHGRTVTKIFGAMWGKMELVETMEEAFASVGMEAPSDEHPPPTA